MNDLHTRQATSTHTHTHTHTHTNDPFIASINVLTRSNARCYLVRHAVLRCEVERVQRAVSNAAASSFLLRTRHTNKLLSTARSKGVWLFWCIYAYMYVCMYVCITYIYIYIQVCPLHRTLLFHTAVWYLATVSSAPAQHTIAPHVTIPHPTLAHAPISIQPSLFQDTHLILRTKVRFCLNQRFHDLDVTSFRRIVQRCLLQLICT